MSWNESNGVSVAEEKEAASKTSGRRSGTRSVFSHGEDTVIGDVRSRSKVSTQPTQPVGNAKAPMDARSAALLATKQVQLDKTVDRHDDLVRELFHMEHFTMMLSYDPAEAKMEQTAVFREYKAKYDLIDKAAPVAGPSRQTRGRLNERRQILANTTLSAPPSAPSLKRKSKPKVDRKAEIMETLASVAPYKGKGKEKQVISAPPPAVPAVQTQETSPVVQLSAVATQENGGDAGVVYVTRNFDKNSVSSKPAIEAPPVVEVVPSEVLVDDDSIVYVTRKKPTPTRPAVEQVQDEPSGPSLSPLTSHKPPSSVHKQLLHQSDPRTGDLTLEKNSISASTVDDIPTEFSSGAARNGHASYHIASPNDSISAGLQQRRSGRLKPPPFPPVQQQQSSHPQTPKIKLRFSAEDKSPRHDPRSLVSNVVSSPQRPPPYVPSIPPQASISHHSPSKTGPKRVKLIVRRPPPPLTNPQQRPPKPKYNYSLQRFLSSYTMIDEGDISASILEQQARQEAILRERVERFRREGRVFLDADGTVPEDLTNSGPTHIQTDVWSHIVEAVIEKGRTRPKKSIAQVTTSQIASKIHVYFDGLEQRKIKAKDAEGRRLRALARSTMKLISAEWRKALYHVRERQRQEQEEEERRLGHAHLDAILDQSGQLLETQQGDLLRGDIPSSRSRSGSIADFDDQGEEEEEDEEERTEDEEEEEEEEEEEPGIETLINGLPLTNEDEHNLDDSSLLEVGMGSPGTRTPASTGSDYPEEDRDVSTAQLLNGKSQDVDMRTETSFDDAVKDFVVLNPDLSPVQVNGSQDLSQIDYLSLDQNPHTGTRDMHIQDRPSQALESVEATSGAAVQDVLGRDSQRQSRSHEIELSSNNQPESEQDRLTRITDDPGDPSTSVEQLDVPILDDHIEQGEPPAGGEEEQESDKEDENKEAGPESQVPAYLRPFAVVPVEWDSESKVTPPLLLRGVLRPYQQSGLEWLASLHSNKLNGILADEMGLGKTIQTIALLAHLACDRGIWGPHLIVVPTSVLLNWEMEFKKFLPGFKVLSYHGSTKRRKELRQGWNDKFHFNVCITSYTLASRDAHIFKRKPWYYMVLDEAHMIKNFKSQRWNILLMFRSYRRLLLTGTPLQNNLTELWSLLQFLMSGSNFANLKEFAEWFSNPLEKAIEMGNVNDDETVQRVSKLHTVLRPYLLRRLKRDVERELPSKVEHLVLCPLSKRQRFLYDEFMSRAQTRDALNSGVYQKIANILMQLRKVCNHPDLFEVRPIVTSFAMQRSAVADFEIKEMLIRRRFLLDEDDSVNLDVVGLQFIGYAATSLWASALTRSLDATTALPHYGEIVGEPPPKDTRTIAGFRQYSVYVHRARIIARWTHAAYLNKLRCSRMPVIPEGLLTKLSSIHRPILPFSFIDPRFNFLDNVDRVNKAVKSYSTRAREMRSLIDRFAFVTPPVVALDLPHLALSGYSDIILKQPIDFDETVHFPSVKLQIAFPDPSLLQYDCGKLQQLASLLREKKAGGHRILIFTQMTRILDILEVFLNFHGYLYLRLDGATKIEDRQYITERFNADPRIFCFIASSRSGGVGINLTGADTVVFYDSDFNPQMDKQCEDRAHRIGQIRDVHIYRFVSQYTVEEAMLRKANQKRSLDDLVIQKGEFDWRTLFNDEGSGALTKALGEFEDVEDRNAAAIAAREEFSLVGADEADFGEGEVEPNLNATRVSTPVDVEMGQDMGDGGLADAGVEVEEEEQGGSIVDYMLAWVEQDYDDFREVKLL